MKLNIHHDMRHKIYLNGNSILNNIYIIWLPFAIFSFYTTALMSLTLILKIFQKRFRVCITILPGELKFITMYAMYTYLVVLVMP